MQKGRAGQGRAGQGKAGQGRAGARTVLQLPPRASLSKLVSLDCLKGTWLSLRLSAFTVCSKKVRDLLIALASCIHSTSPKGSFATCFCSCSKALQPLPQFQGLHTCSCHLRTVTTLTAAVRGCAQGPQAKA